MCVYVCVCMYVCMYVCVCMCVCMCVCILGGVVIVMVSKGKTLVLKEPLELLVIRRRRVHTRSS